MKKYFTVYFEQTTTCSHSFEAETEREALDKAEDFLHLAESCEDFKDKEHSDIKVTYAECTGE